MPAEQVLVNGFQDEHLLNTLHLHEIPLGRRDDLPHLGTGEKHDKRTVETVKVDDIQFTQYLVTRRDPCKDLGLSARRQGLAAVLVLPVDAAAVALPNPTTPYASNWSPTSDSARPDT